MHFSIAKHNNRFKVSNTRGSPTNDTRLELSIKKPMHIKKDKSIM